MRQGKSSTNANRIKKQQRQDSRQGLPSYYTKIVREPDHKRLKSYTKIVTEATADKLIKGKIELGLNGISQRVKLSREFTKAS